MQRTNSAYGTIISFAILIIIILVGVIVVLSAQPEPVTIVINPPQPTETPMPTNTPDPIVIYVTGEVNQPEAMVALPVGSRVEDAIAAAGGVTDHADMARVNLAGILHDGDQVHVPLLEESAGVEILPTPSGGAVIYINTATLEELDTLPGVGPALAASIIAYREANGAFTSLEDLDQVSGIGPRMLETIKDLISFAE